MSNSPTCVFDKPRPSPVVLIDLPGRKTFVSLNKPAGNKSTAKDSSQIFVRAVFYHSYESFIRASPEIHTPVFVNAMIQVKKCRQINIHGSKRCNNTRSCEADVADEN